MTRNSFWTTLYKTPGNIWALDLEESKRTKITYFLAGGIVLMIATPNIDTPVKHEDHNYFEIEIEGSLWS